VDIEMVAITEIIGGFSGFKARMLLFAGVIVLAGSIWTNGREMHRSGNVFRAPGAPMSANFSVGTSSGKGDVLLHKGDLWGKGAVTLGLSFMIAMITGSLLRAALKTAVTLLLLSGVAVWILENQGYVSLWDDYLQSVQQGGDWATAHVDLIGGFLQKHLPSAGVALIGFGMGLKR
jgi:uncharacterized membrane protein (Fun14 family)